MKFSLIQDSRLGARRVNQDRVGHWRSPESLLMVVADGLGGHLHGEIAAQTALDHLEAAFMREACPRLAKPDLFLVRAIAGAHAAILAEADRRGLSEAPRTVIVACVVQEGHAHWAHIGDSRLYLVRQGRILVRTRDHTIVQRLIEEGRIREEAAANHPERNRLLQCLGGVQAPHFDPPASQRLAKHDVLILCSDGFWGALTQRQLVSSLLMHELPQAIPELVGLAETRAGPQCDNVSVVAMRWDEDADETERSAA